MVDIGNRYNKKTIALITNMNIPLGNMIGNGLEIKKQLIYSITGVIEI